MEFQQHRGVSNPPDAVDIHLAATLIESAETLSDGAG